MFFIAGDLEARSESIKAGTIPPSQTGFRDSASDTRELFYRKVEKMMAVGVPTGSGFTAGMPKVLFERQYACGIGTTMANYDVTPDGHLVMVKNEPVRLNVVLNWFEELKRNVPIP